MLSRLSIRTKIVSVISFLLLALLVTGVFAIVQMRSINASTQDIQTNWLPSVRWLGELRTQVARHRTNLRDHLLATDAKGRSDAENALAARVRDYGEAVKQYEPMISSPEEQKLFDQVRADGKNYISAVEEVVAASRNGEADKARKLLQERTLPFGLALEAGLNKLVDLNNAGGAAAGKTASDDYSLSFRAVLALLVAATLGSLLAGFYLVRDVSRGIASIVSPMKSLGEGDLTAIVPHQGEKTEIGTMADTLQVFKDALIAKKAADEAAAADADAKIARGQRVDAITRDFEKLIGELVGSLSSSSTELEAAANTLTSTAEVTGRTSGEAAAASQDVSSNVQSVAVATEEITSSVGEISRQVQESSRIATEAVRQAQKTDTSITELSQAAARIGDVVKLITAVAEQTNLLALNATIEAARAGDAGRGFAVVASEVKALAAQTAKATDEISAQVAGMQTATQESVSTIKEIGKTITLISEISQTIAAAVEEQGAATQEISRNVQQAASLSGEVAVSITDVSRGAGETGAASGQVLSAAQMLSTDSTRLKTEVEKFLTNVRAA